MSRTRNETLAQRIIGKKTYVTPTLTVYGAVKLPPSVHQRVTKAEFSCVFLDAFRKLDGRQFNGLSIADNGWIDGRIVKLMYDQTMRRYNIRGEFEGKYYKYILPLWRVFAIELWYNTLFGLEGSTAGRARVN